MQRNEKPVITSDFEPSAAERKSFLQPHANLNYLICPNPHRNVNSTTRVEINDYFPGDYARKIQKIVNMKLKEWYMIG